MASIGSGSTNIVVPIEYSVLKEQINLLDQYHDVIEDGKLIGTNSFSYNILKKQLLKLPKKMTLN